MKKFVTYLLCSLMLCQVFQLDLSQFSKFKNLVEHYQFHQEEFGDDFWSFVDLHYGKQQNQHESEHDDHEHLPVNDCHHFCHHSIYLSSNTYEIPILSANISSEVDINHSDNFSFLAISEVFQPPKNLSDYKS